MLGKHKSTLARILKSIRAYQFLVLLSFLLAGVSVALTLYIPVLIGQAVDCIIGQSQVDFFALARLIQTMIWVVAATALAQWLMNVTNNHITYRVVKDLRTKAFAQLEELPLSYLDSRDSGDTLSRIINDVDQFSDGLLMGFTQLFTALLTIAGTLIFMFSVNFWIALVVVLVTPVSLFVASYIAKRTYQMFRAQAEAKGEMTGFVDEMLEGQKVVRAFGYEERAMERFDHINERFCSANLKATFFSSITNPATRFVNGLVYASVGIVGAMAVIRGLLSVGQLTCFLSYANQYSKPFNEISGVVTELQNALASAARVFQLIDEKPQVPEDGQAVSLQQPDGTVELAHVYFSYQSDKKLIEDFNLSVKPGQRVAIVGPTGCGKSTVINLLMRFYDVDQGSIMVSGHDIRQLTRESLRKNYGMVLQETWLKSATIAENIAFGKPDASPEQIRQAAREAYAHSFIKRLPKGYDTVISEDGGSLSQGQKQLLCIARVMLCLPPMLILDEATSSIDTRTELLIQQAFFKMMKGRTSFIVAHRLSTIQEADVILVMRQGQIVEQGSHSQLLEAQGFYAQLYLSQFSGS